MPSVDLEHLQLSMSSLLVNFCSVSTPMYKLTAAALSTFATTLTLVSPRASYCEEFLRQYTCWLLRSHSSQQPAKTLPEKHPQEPRPLVHPSTWSPPPTPPSRIPTGSWLWPFRLWGSHSGRWHCSCPVLWLKWLEGLRVKVPWLVCSKASSWSCMGEIGNMNE